METEIKKEDNNNNFDEDFEAELPDLISGKLHGVLPLIIKNLVDRRKQVKALLKSENNQAKKINLDIKQKAIKLIANSIYGCMGFSNSRFI